MGLLHRRVDSGPLFDLPEGRRRRDEGIERVEANASDDADRWKHEARAWIERRAQRSGEFNADDMRRDIGDPPGNPNIMGAVWLWAVKQGLVAFRRYRPRQAANAHSQKISVYVGAAFAPQPEGERL